MQVDSKHMKESPTSLIIRKLKSWDITFHTLAKIKKFGDTLLAKVGETDLFIHCFASPFMSLPHSFMIIAFECEVATDGRPFSRAPSAGVMLTVR